LILGQKVTGWVTGEQANSTDFFYFRFFISGELHG
jgi:hypothetical protein